MDKIVFCNVIFRGLDMNTVLCESKGIKIVFTVNAQFIVLANEDPVFREILNENLTTFDGQVPFILAKMQNYGRRFQKISGSDLMYEVFDMASRTGKKVFFLGGYPDSNRMAVSTVREKYGIEIDGFSPPYKPFPFEPEHTDMLIERIAAFRPAILFVSFGTPKQEFWITENKDKLADIGVKWVMGSGGAFELICGKFSRAPRLIQRIGFEGLYRIIQEPKWFRVKRLLMCFKIFKYI